MPTLTKDEERIYITALEAEGFSISKKAPKERARSRLDIPVKPGNKLKLGIVSDPHYNSHEQQPTYMHAFYKYADSAGVSAYLNLGDNDDGTPKMHRDAIFHQFNHGFDRRVAYVVSEYPKSQNGPTYLIDGNHDWSWYAESGVSFGQALALKREDIQYLGYREAFVEIGPAKFLLRHGAKGGMSYARSYKIQKLIEQMAEKDKTETDVALYGHWHVAMHLPGYQGIEAFAVPCFQSQTTFLRDLGVQPVIGGLVLEIEFGQKGVYNVRPDWQVFRTPLLNDYPGADR
jgi:predicted phosphodiesterase